MSDQALQVFDEGGIAEFGTFRNPEVAMKEAELVAASFAKRAERLQLYKKIGESKHLLIEGWQMLASMYRVTASISRTQYIQYGDVAGFEASADAIHVPSGKRISSADAQCLNDEERWTVRPKYEVVNGVRTQTGTVAVPMQQLRSMAQTRACSKVLSNLLKFVARMAGFAGTPAEEMTGHEQPHDESGGAAVQQPQRKGSGAPISEAQAKRFYAIAKGKGMDDAAIKEYCQSWGFEKSVDITKDKYDAMCAIAPAPKAAEPKQTAAPQEKIVEYPDFKSVPDAMAVPPGTQITVAGVLYAAGENWSKVVK